jgi:hypothetical protein
MPNTLSRQEVKRFALIGAQARLAELREEIASLVRAFPELSRSNGSARKSAAAGETAATPTKKAARRRRNFNMSAEQKQAVSERMTKYWAARRKEKSGKSKATKAAKAVKAAAKA